MRERVLAGVGAALLFVALVTAYANHFHNSFHFDDAHTIVNNASIRELRNIPMFFRDATTFSSLPSNQSYRPLVSTLFAIDYWLGHGLRPFWFHLSIFALFVALVLLAAFFIYELIGPPKDGFAVANNLWIALGAAALYGLHPANADTVNYIIASSEVISTLGVITSFAVYFAFPRSRQYYLYVLPGAIAILAKPIAAVFALLFAIYRLLFPPSQANLAGTSGRPQNLSWFAEVVPPLMICAVSLPFVQYMTPHSWIAGAANAHNYLITQPYVTLLYFETFFWPSGLSADYDLNPFGTIADPRFWGGLVFVIVFTASAASLSAFKKTRVIGFGLLWFLVALLPTSLFPLAEVMNDHRTFLPYFGLVIAMAGAAAFLVSCLDRQPSWTKIAAACAVVLFLCANAYATFRRNKVWKTEETLWHDVVLKSPGNGRGLMNYGNTLMAKGDYTGALDNFHRAQRLTPHYSVLLINLAIAEDATRQSAQAEDHFKDALRLAPSSPDSYTFYARYLITHSRAGEARGFLQLALKLSPTDLTARGLLSRANSEAGNQPGSTTAESYLAQSLQFYREERYVEVIGACRRALALRPDYAEAWNNICAAYNKLGRYDEASSACEQALSHKPDFELARNNLQYAREKLRAASKP